MKSYKEILESNIVDKIGRKLKVKTTKGKPTKKDAPKWAKFLGMTNEGRFHWLSNDTIVDKKDSNKYFPDANKSEFSGFEVKPSKGYVEKL